MQRFFHQRCPVLLDVVEHGLVGDENEHVIQSIVFRVDVIPANDFSGAVSHVPQEGTAVLLDVRFRLRFNQFHVVGQRKLGVHVELLVIRHQYGEIRPRTAVGSGGLLGVIYRLYKADQTENVLSHSLAPLAADLGVGQDVLEGRGTGVQAGQHGFQSL